MNHLATFALILIINAVMDYLAVLFTQTVVKQERLKAGIVSVALTVMGLGTVYLIIEDVTNIFPAAIGSFLGTYLTMRKKK
jgi:uncharacterized protein YebE (UPF0316 family)